MPFDKNDRYDRPNRNDGPGNGGNRFDRGGDRPYSNNNRFDRDRGGYRDRGEFQPRDNRGFGNDRNDRYDRNDRSYDADRRFESVFSNKVRAGKRRTYFFDVQKTKGNDFYLTITESTKRPDESFSRHKIFIYKEDFNRFLEALTGAIDHVKTNLLPDYDYDEYARRYEQEEGGEGGDFYPAPKKRDDSDGVSFRSFDSDEEDGEDFEEDDEEDFDEEEEEDEDEVDGPTEETGEELPKSSKKDDDDMEW